MKIEAVVEGLDVLLEKENHNGKTNNILQS